MKEGWDKPLTDWIIEVKKYTNAEISIMVTEALRRIKERTPVGTGTLQAGWYMDEMMKGGILDVVIHNDVEYVVFVEYGTEKMAGRHMVEQTLNEMIEGVF